MKTRTRTRILIFMMVLLGFIAIYRVQAIEKKAYGYNDTVIVLSIVDGSCNAVMYKSDESDNAKRYTISCEEAKKIILTFP